MGVGVLLEGGLGGCEVFKVFGCGEGADVDSCVERGQVECCLEADAWGATRIL